MLCWCNKTLDICTFVVVGKNTNGMLVTFPRFETNAEKYIYLIDTPCVAIGKGGDGVRYDVYAVKPAPKL